ncbi:MAG: hypothetical protein R3E95_21565 [Thiolinea sp.]
MKYLFPALMGAVILIGLLVNVTPYVAGYFFPAGADGYQKASPAQAQEALASWFEASPQDFGEVLALRKQENQDIWRWYRFAVGRQAVEHFIRRLGLQQNDLDAAVLQAEFMAEPPPVDWWQPAELERRSYFSGQDQGMSIRLIYHAERELGFLLIRSTGTSVSAAE